MRAMRLSRLPALCRSHRPWRCAHQLLPTRGEAGIAKLAPLLDQPALPLDPEHGSEKPRMLARIVEADCIGCTKCIQACPVDAIVGSAKWMDTVIVDDCTGCGI